MHVVKKKHETNMETWWNMDKYGLHSIQDMNVPIINQCQRNVKNAKCSQRIHDLCNHMWDISILPWGGTSPRATLITSGQVTLDYALVVLACSDGNRDTIQILGTKHDVSCHGPKSNCPRTK
jgi:hypothetical protein